MIISAFAKNSLFLTALGFMILPSMAHADSKVRKLTENNVRTFIEKSADMAAGTGNYSYKDIVKFFENHIDEGARFKTILEYHVPGFPVQKTEMVLDKETFISHTQQGLENLKDIEADLNIESINVASNGRQAIVITNGKTVGNMPVPESADAGSASIDVPLEGTSRCTQTINLDKRKGIIQMYNATCTTQVEFSGLAGF